jgi:hypothetical protein
MRLAFAVDRNRPNYTKTDRELNLRHGSSQAPKFHNVDLRGLARHQVAQRIGRIIAADAVVIGIHFENVFGPAGIVLERGEAIHQPAATRVEEEARSDGGSRIAQALEDLGPAVDSVHVGRRRCPNRHRARRVVAGRDLQGVRHLRQRHPFHLALAKVLQEALRCAEELQRGIPFLLAVLPRPQGPVGGLLLLRRGFRLGLLLKEPGVKGLNPLAPAVPGGPHLDAAQLFAQLPGHGRNQLSRAFARRIALATGVGEDDLLRPRGPLSAREPLVGRRPFTAETFDRHRSTYWGRSDEQAAQQHLKHCADALGLLFFAAPRPGRGRARRQLPAVVDSFIPWCEQTRKDFQLDPQIQEQLAHRKATLDLNHTYRQWRAMQKEDPDMCRLFRFKDDPQKDDHENLRLTLETIPTWAPGRSMRGEAGGES